jgi:UDP-2,3-diacylglucosamine hydrolase
MGLYFSHKSRIANIAREQKNDFRFIIEEEMLHSYCESVLAKNSEIDYFVFGHRHMPIVHPMNKRTNMVILGDWVTNFSYAVFDGEKLDLLYFI